LLLVCLGFAVKKYAVQPVSLFGEGRWNCGPPKGVPDGAKCEFQAMQGKKWLKRNTLAQTLTSEFGPVDAFIHWELSVTLLLAKDLSLYLQREYLSKIKDYNQLVARNWLLYPQLVVSVISCC